MLKTIAWFTTPISQERLVLAAVGFLQGLAVWIVHRMNPKEPWEQALWFGALAWILVWGIIVQFASSGTKHRPLEAIALGLAIPFALITYHVVGQLAPRGATYEGDEFRLATWTIGGTLALYILLPYLQIYQQSGRLRFPYAELYRFSWNNLFLAALGWFYVGVYWTLVWVCAGLFKALGISAIQELVTKPSFVAITTGIMGGLGLALAKEHERIITTLRTIAATLFRSLTPLLVVIVLSFLVTLPFTGLAPLWATKWASAILLALLLLILLFVNAVFQDGEGPIPYAILVRRGVEAMLLGMPILVGLTLYSMGLRIAQYGFTPERYYAIVFAIVLGGYGLGYAWAVLAKQEKWLGRLRELNIALSFVVLGLVFFLHTPLMDPLKRSAEDQEQRLLTGAIAASAFDFGTLRFELGHYGQAVLDRLAMLPSHPEQALITERLKHLKTAANKHELTKTQQSTSELLGGMTPEQIRATLIVVPEGQLVPPELLATILEINNRTKFYTCQIERRCTLVAGQWDEDSEQEYVFVSSYHEKDSPFYTIHLYDRTEKDTWKSIADVLVSIPAGGFPRDEAITAAREGRLRFRGIQYHCATIGTARACDFWGNDRG